jgi:hypothetical protein
MEVSQVFISSGEAIMIFFVPKEIPVDGRRILSSPQSTPISPNYHHCYDQVLLHQKLCLEAYLCRTWLDFNLMLEDEILNLYP